MNNAILHDEILVNSLIVEKNDEHPAGAVSPTTIAQCTPVKFNAAPSVSIVSDWFHEGNHEGDEYDGEETPAPKPCASMHTEIIKEANTGDELQGSVGDYVEVVRANLAAFASICPELFPCDELSTAEEEGDGALAYGEAKPIICVDKHSPQVETDGCADTSWNAHCPPTVVTVQGRTIVDLQEPRRVRFTENEPSIPYEEPHAGDGLDHDCFATLSDLEALMCASRGLRTVAQSALDKFMPIDLSSDDADLGEYPDDQHDYNT